MPEKSIVLWYPLQLWQLKRHVRPEKKMNCFCNGYTYAEERKLWVKYKSFPITLGDKTYTSRVDFDNDQFFSLMAQYDEIPKTAQITPYQFQEIYLREAQAGVTDLLWHLRFEICCKIRSHSYRSGFFRYKAESETGYENRWLLHHYSCEMQGGA